MTNSSSIEVTRGLYIKPQRNSPYLQAYCRLKRQTYRKSTGASDVHAAEQIALQWFFALKNDLAQNRSTKRKSWAELRTAYLASLPAGAKRDYHQATIDRHLGPFFGSLKDLNLINSGMIAKYLVHRRMKKGREPLPQTLNRENIVLRGLLKFAEVQDWIAPAPAVPFIPDRLAKRRRRHFTDEEYRRLRMTALRRIRQIKLHGDNRERIAVLPYRQLLYDVIQLLANSGLRVDELKNLIWRNVLWEEGDVLLEAAGKTRSSRRLILRQAAIRALRRIAQRRLNWMRAQGEEAKLAPDERVIALACGTSVKSMKHGFSLLLAECGFSYRTAKDRHSLTSLRHTYATQSLTRKSGVRPPLHVLAKQMGTSEKMIQAHYGHDAIEDYRDELRG